MTHVTVSRRGAMAGALAGSALAVGSRRAWAQGKPLQIGLLQTLSGPLASVGQAHLTGARIAVKMINDAGGVDGRPLELAIRDSRANANDMVAGLRELAGAGINLIFGEAFTGPNLAAVPLAPSLGVLYVCTSVTGMDFTHDLFNRNMFRAGPNAHMQYFGDAKTIVTKHPELNRIGTFVADSAGFRSAQVFFHAAFRKFYAEIGKKIELPDPVVAKVGAGDYRNQCNDLLGQKLDALMICDAGGEMITFIRQARAMGLFNTIKVAGDTTYSPDLGPALRKEIPSNYYSFCTWYYDAYKEVPLAQAFFKAASEQSKAPVLDPFLAQTHTAITAIAEGVRRARSTETDAVIKVMEGMTFDTVYGPLSFRPEDHQLRVDSGYLRLGPDDTAEGWKVQDFVRISWKETMEPASPGKKFEI